MKILKFHHFERNTLKGFIEVETPAGMIIRNITWHQKVAGEKTSEWLSMPSREYAKADGSKGYSNQVDFVSKNLYWDFVNAVLEALKRHLGDEKLEEAWSGEEQAEEREEVPADLQF
jgi:hypothetical protein